MAPHWENSRSLISKNHLSVVSASCPTAFACRSAREQRWGARRREEPIISDPYGFRRGREGGRRGLGLRRCLSTYLSTSRRRRASHKRARWNSSVQMLFYSSFRVRQDPTCSSVSHQRRRIRRPLGKKKTGVLQCACIWWVRVSWQNVSILRFPLILPQPPQNCLAV